MKLFIKSILLLIILAILTGCTGDSSMTASATPTPIPTSIVPNKPLYEVQQGDVINILQFNARITPILEEDLFFRTNGFVHAVYAKRGDMVEAGQVIADLEGLADLERNYAFQQIQVQKAEVLLENAQLSLEIYKETSFSPYGYKELELQMRENEVKLAELNLAEARLNLEDLQSSVDQARIIAPFDGLILSMSISAGKEVSAFRPVVTIGDISQLEASVELSATDLKEISVGMPVTIEPFNKPGTQLVGQIRLLPSTSQSGSVEDKNNAVRIEFDSDSGVDFELGDLVIVRLEIEKRIEVLWLPPQAIRSFGGRNFVVVQDGSDQRSVDISLGIQSEDRVEILPVEGQQNLQEGQIVVGP
jgi:RND family efflux transporter MFP subunit